MDVNGRPRLRKPQNMFKIKLITRTANEAMREIQGYSKGLPGFQQLVINNTLEIAVYVFFI